MAENQNFKGAASKISKQIVANVVPNAAYLVRGAMKIDEAQLAGKLCGTEYDFVLFTPSATKIGSTTVDSNLSNLSSSKVTLKAEEYAGKIDAGSLDKAYNMGNWEEIVTDMCDEVVNTAVKDVAVWDMSKIAAAGNVNVVSNYKGIAKVSAKLASQWKGKQFGFADPTIVGELQGDGRNAVPVSVEGAWGVGLEGKLFNISELRTLALPTVTAPASSAATCSVSNGVATLSASQEAGVYKFGDAIVVVDTDGTTGRTAASNGSYSNSSAATYSAMIVRMEKAQAYGDLGGNLTAADEKKSVEGITIGVKKKEGNLMGGHYLYETAIAGGLADAKKAALILMSV